MIVAVWAAGFFTGIINGVFGERWRVARRPPKIEQGDWHELPSGWSSDVRGLSVYAMTQGPAAYWWVSRNGKTIIEGPAGSLEAAKLEAEREARELA